MLTRLRLDFSHFRKHKFRNGFKDTLNPLCFCSIEAETTTCYFQRCHFCNPKRVNLTNDLEDIPIPFFTVSEDNLISSLLYGDDKFDDTKKRKILMQLSDSLKVLRGSMSNFFDNLSTCHAYAVLFIYHFLEDFLLHFQRASFTRYFTLGFFL